MPRLYILKLLVVGAEMKSSDMEAILNERVNILRQTLSETSSIPSTAIKNLVIEILECFANGGKLAFVGNGGSAAEAMHLAAEFTGKCVVDHEPLPAICLNESQSALTAIANDYGVDFIFSRQVKAHLRRGDILIALSTSGKSKNIVSALETGSTLGVRGFLWTGKSAPPLESIEVWRAPSDSTPRIQEMHLIWGHLVSEILELSL